MVEDKCKNGGWQDQKLNAKGVMGSIISGLELLEDKKAGSY